MNLLPKNHKDFKQQAYWNTFFKKRGKKAFEWYGEYPELCAHLHKYIKPKDDILVIGCGNSSLSMDLYDVGYRKITNIDISKVVIRQMQDSNKVKRPELKYLQMDVLNMEFDAESFSVILDKGTLDALMPDDSEDTLLSIQKLFSEIGRVLKVGGRYVCISLLQEHILRTLVDHFPQNNWMFRVVRCLEVEQKTTENSEGVSLPVFAVVATKFKELGQMVLEMCMGGDKMLRLNETDEIMSAVKEIQTTALICSRLAQNTIVGEPVKLDLYRPGDNAPRFTIYVMDQIVTKPGKLKRYAVFIVPQGRESDWLFSTSEGRANLLKSVEQDRLAVVTMHRGQNYESWESVKAELTENIKLLKPPGSEENIPFLSLGTDVGFRVELYRGNSKMSGEYVIEEIPQHPGVDTLSLRRLIFLSNPFLVQSEASVRVVKTRNRTRYIVDTGKLSCEHHIYMTVGVQLSLMNFEKRPVKGSKEKSTHNSARSLVIGLGGGGLCTFLHHHFKNLHLLAVEIDPEMLKVAENYFGLQQDFRFQIKIDDGIKFLLDSAEKGEKFDSILFDVDNKDPSVAIRCPPKEFLESSLLNAVKECLTDKGIFILNLVCRDEDLRKSVIESLKNIFQSVSSYRLEQDLNVVIFCTSVENFEWKPKIQDAANSLNKLAIKSDQSKEMVALAEVLDCLSIH